MRIQKVSKFKKITLFVRYITLSISIHTKIDTTKYKHVSLLREKQQICVCIEFWHSPQLYQDQQTEVTMIHIQTRILTSFYSFFSTILFNIQQLRMGENEHILYTVQSSTIQLTNIYILINLLYSI